jgi:hypothetical protein
MSFSFDIGPKPDIGESASVVGSRCKATWKREFKLPWREAGPPYHGFGPVACRYRPLSLAGRGHGNGGDARVLAPPHANTLSPLTTRTLTTRTFTCVTLQ